MSVRTRGILASAGTGKTHALTTELLRLLMEGCEPQTVFAATFTRTAAGEILDRVLRRLIDAAEDSRKLAGLRKDLGNNALTHEACTVAAARLARALDRLKVMTLDAFLMRVATAFAVEIGLPPGWRISGDDEDAQIRRAAVARVLREGGTAIIQPLLRMLKKAEGERSVREAIASVVDAVHALHTQAVAGAWERIVSSAAPLSDEAVVTLRGVIEGAQLPRTSDGKSLNKNWVKARTRLLELLDAANWHGILDSGLGAAARGDGTYYRVPFPEVLGDACRKLIGHARAQCAAQLAQQNLAAGQLAERFDRAYEALKRERGGIRFEDLPRLLMAEDLASIRDELYYRLDARIQHVLLDEFQDTSVPQFRVLEPLLAEIVSDETRERSLFYVGDAKQSLFGWRHAEPTLLGMLGRRWPQITVEDLSRSFRSAPPIIEAVNRVFTGLQQNPAMQGEGAMRAARDWDAMFTTHSWAAELERVPGRMVLRQFPEVKESDPDRDVLASWRCEYIAGRAEAILAEAGARGAASISIGILLRTKNSVPRLLMALQARGIDAAEEGGSFLTQSPAVAAVVSLLRVAEHPGDTLAAFHVATTALGAAVGLSRAVDPAAVGAVGGEVRERITRGGVSEVVGEWARWLTPVCAPLDRTRLMQMVECAEQYDARGGTGVRGFLELLDSTRKPAGAPAAVRVMTIHAAKGLEFDAVLAPDLDGLVPQRPPEVLFSRDDLMGPITRLSLYAPDVVQETSAELQEMATDRRSKDIREALCLLYVTMTRAKRYLEMIVSPASGGESFRLSRVVRGALVDADAGEDGILNVSGSEDWPVDPRESARREEAHAPTPQESLDEGNEIVVGVGRSSRQAAASASDLDDEDAGDGAVGAERRGAPAGVRRSARGLGTAVHACLEQVTWLEDGLSSDADLRAVLAQTDLPFDVDEESVIARFRAIVKKPLVAALLGRDRYLAGASAGTTVELQREIAGVSVDRTGRVLRGRMDRVVVVRENGRPRWAEVVDWKTDGMVASPGAAPVSQTALPGLEVRAEAYGAQMGAYRSVIARTLGIGMPKVRTTLVFAATGEIVTRT